MKQTNHTLFDFLDFDPENSGGRSLWIAGPPAGIDREGGDIVVTLPLQKQKSGVEIAPDRSVERKKITLRIRSYGFRVLRMCTGEHGAPMSGSEMLDISPELEVIPLDFRKENRQWIIFDSRGVRRAVFDFSKPQTRYWSDLIPPPEEQLVASFYPDGIREVGISSYDQFFPARQDAFPLAFLEEGQRFQQATLSFHSEAGEVFCGTGERFAKMDLAGRTVQLKNQDGQGVNSRRTYKNIPFYLSSRMYGCFLHTSAFSKFSLADHSSRSVQIYTEEPLLDLFLFGGDSPEQILRGYRMITGFPAMPPLWSFGIWMSRMSYFSAEEVEGICLRLRDEGFPCDVIHLDTGWFRTDWLCEWKFNPERFPDPEGFVKRLRERGYRVSLWQLPYISAGAEQLEEAVANRYTGQVRESEKRGGSDFSALDYAGTIDFTNPQAVVWYQGLLKRLLEMGVACIKTDFGEEIHMNARYHSMAPEVLSNLYPLLYQKAAFEVTREVTGEGIIWARAAWAACQRFPLHWGGDAASSHDGMAGSLKGGLHLGLSGFAFWSHDVPGFHGLPDFMNQVIPDELYVRWTQFGVFSSHIRYHGTSAREPWEFPAVAELVRKWWRLRYTLIPYILEQSHIAITTGFPFLRALVFHHPGDKMCWHIDDQYYFGSDFLVAPVMKGENRRDIYLPEGSWVNFFDGTTSKGPQWLKDFESPLEEMPVWVRQGTSIPVYPFEISCTDEMDFANVTTLKMDDSFKGIFKTRWEGLS